MTILHKDLAQGRWQQMPLCEQMANIGSEVERSLNWRSKNNIAYSQKAFERALELIDITLEGITDLGRLKEIARVREVLADYFVGSNEFLSTDISLKKYFFCFALLSRKYS